MKSDSRKIFIAQTLKNNFNVNLRKFVPNLRSIRLVNCSYMVGQLYIPLPYSISSLFDATPSHQLFFSEAQQMNKYLLYYFDFDCPNKSRKIRWCIGQHSINLISPIIWLVIADYYFLWSMENCFVCMCVCVLRSWTFKKKNLSWRSYRREPNCVLAFFKYSSCRFVRYLCPTNIYCILCSHRP